MKKTIIISVICLSLFSFVPAQAGCINSRTSNDCDCTNADCLNGNYVSNQTCQCLSANTDIIRVDTKVCYKTNSKDSNYNYHYCGSLFSRCNNNNCACNSGANKNISGCFKSNYIDKNGGNYYCEESAASPQSCANNQYANCSDANMAATHRNTGGNTIINVQSGGNVYLNGYEARPEATPTNYRNFISKGQGVYTRDLKRIPIGIIHMFGADSDKDGLPDDFERAVGTDPNNFNTDRDRYSDKTEIVAGFNPNGAGRLWFDQRIINKFKGKFLIQTEQSGELWYVNPKDGKRYFVGNEFDAMELIKAFKL